MTKIDWYKPCTYNEPQKHLFHREARKCLQALAVALCLPRQAYDLRSNKGGIAVSGEITLHTGTLYVQVCQPATGWDSGVLIRTCKGRNDYTGGPNNFAPLRDLDGIERLAGHCQRVLARQGGRP
jgi:hypothetical protein